jgi:hypothetical protein
MEPANTTFFSSSAKMRELRISKAQRAPE